VVGEPRRRAGGSRAGQERPGRATGREAGGARPAWRRAVLSARGRAAWGRKLAARWLSGQGRAGPGAERQAERDEQGGVAVTCWPMQAGRALWASWGAWSLAG
jgi:hypothetical protein